MNNQIKPFDADNSAKYSYYAPNSGMDDTFTFHPNALQNDVLENSHQTTTCPMIHTNVGQPVDPNNQPIHPGFFQSIDDETRKIYHDVITKPTGISYRDFYASNPQDVLLRDAMTHSPFFNYMYDESAKGIEHGYDAIENKITGKNGILILIIVLLVGLVGWEYWKEPSTKL